MKRWSLMAIALAAAIAAALAGPKLVAMLMGRQPDGSFVVSTGQRIPAGTIAFDGRPSDMAKHPSRDLLAVIARRDALLIAPSGVLEASRVRLPDAPASRGLIWHPDGSRLYAGLKENFVQVLEVSAGKLALGPKIDLRAEPKAPNPVPAGMALTRDGRRLFVACVDLNAVVEVDTATNARVREWPAQMLPFHCALSPDEQTLAVSNLAGRAPKLGQMVAQSGRQNVLTNPEGKSVSGTVTLIDLTTGDARQVDVGLHPGPMAFDGGTLYVANQMGDSISSFGWRDKRPKVSTLAIRYGGQRLLGSIPTSIAVRGGRLFTTNGGDNALCEIDVKTRRVQGFRQAGYFPVAAFFSMDGNSAFVLNSKGNGSVARTIQGKPGNAHDFQGTVSIIDLGKPLAEATAEVARNNSWDGPDAAYRPTHPVYRGAIKHVLYIIKENRTYDEVFGDLPQGNGDARLCSLGETVMPNHRKLAREFTLFDNGYVSGTNSADGHQWSTQALANDYLERLYVGHSRSYPDDGEDAMALSAAGFIWDNALRKGRSVRIYGEFCDNDLAEWSPRPPKDWFEMWEDRKSGRNLFKPLARTHIPAMRPLIHPNMHYWPLLQSDQRRADLFLEEFDRRSKAGTVPNLMVLSLPCDHGEGINPVYPTPRAMMADNDLALGRIVEAVSKSPQWKGTCIFVIEDDAQSGPDHVDGHRTVFMAISPWTKRKFVDSSFYTTCSMLRSIELMLGLPPMNRFDALARPMVACFAGTPDLTPYAAVPNNVPLDERNPSPKSMSEADRYWAEKTAELDWSHIDGPDPYWLNRINWYSIHKGRRPYPGRPEDRPGVEDED